MDLATIIGIVLGSLLAHAAVVTAILFLPSFNRRPPVPAEFFVDFRPRGEIPSLTGTCASPER